jgi:hypothetical protein
MKTIDAEAFIKSKLAAEISKYPAGSVSKRDVIMNILDTSEEAYGRLDMCLTKLVYDEALEAMKRRIPLQFSIEQERLTRAALAVIRSLGY